MHAGSFKGKLVLVSKTQTHYEQKLPSKTLARKLFGKEDGREALLYACMYSFSCYLADLYRLNLKLISILFFPKLYC